MAFLRCNFSSQAININTCMHVVIPEDVSCDAGYLYPTLYLLHGYTDDSTGWTRWTAIERYARDYKLAVVMPDVQKSFYCDFYGQKSGYKYWKFVSEELIEVTRRMFRLSHRREDTFVAGLSMGGFGAFKCALNRPDVFSAAASLSGALNIVNDLDDFENKKELEMVFGGIDNVKGGINDLFAAADKTSKLPERPRLYQYCGTEDFLYQGNLKFRDHIQKLNYDYTYVESPGGHEWRYWDEYIKKFIETLDIKRAGE